MAVADAFLLQSLSHSVCPRESAVPPTQRGVYLPAPLTSESVFIQGTLADMVGGKARLPLALSLGRPCTRQLPAPLKMNEALPRPDQPTPSIYLAQHE